ncbi:BrnT family toxin [Microcystis aeruginosa]|nr:BrnT family toxin [Microcystis aeruginosa]UGS09990.1 BrnT family toxin [Microcystis aeruginosa FACHB-905 = DIANCHI905]WKX61063.1 BrnT family toxin [Microcystis aeruginosa PCC 7806]
MIPEKQKPTGKSTVFPLQKEAEMVFFDPLAIHDLDPGCITEERFIAVGMGNMGSLLVVIYTLRGEVIRLISARRATKQERKTYEKGI